MALHQTREQTEVENNGHQLGEADWGTFEAKLIKVFCEPDIAVWMTNDSITVLAATRHHPQMWGLTCATYKKWGGITYHLQQAVDYFLAEHAEEEPSVQSRYQKESLTDLIAADIPPPIQLFDSLMHEGLLLFGGKSKRGKSWLMFDLAIALAVGRSGFRYFACPKPRPVLYLALEDGRARLQSRAKAIQPNLTTANSFHLMYQFPPLSEGGIELLAEEIAQEKYGLVVIDVLAKLEKPKAGKGDKSYHDIYEMFAPLQELRQKHPFCLAMLTHLRKQEADDVFDALMGSVAYQGAQDVLWVLERKPKDDFAFLHIRDKDAEDKVIALRFLDGHWEYVGEGDEYTVARDQRKILKVLTEEKREMGIEEIRKAGEFGDNKYGYVRKLLVTMSKDDLIHHSSYGKYSATILAVKEMKAHDDEVDERGDRVPF
jgi:RecA-family ATPase